MNRPTAVLLVLFAAAFGIRAAIAYHGGIWADEGFLLTVIELPSWGEMIAFLRQHESHPPLFYAVMRVWISLTGRHDAAVLLLPVVIGAGLVPVSYFATRTIFSRNAALLGAGLIAVASGLSEYSAQLRPYGLLPILVIMSSTSFVRALDSGRLKHGVWHAFWTLMLLYTHNWSWLVLAGQGIASVAWLVRSREYRNTVRLAPLLASGLLIAVGYLPWASTFLFQASHAGHQAIPLQGWADRAGALLFAIVVGPQIVLLGTLPANTMPMILVSACVALGAVLLTPVQVKRPRTDFGAVIGSSELEAKGQSRGPAQFVFVTIAMSALVLGGVMASQTNLLISWCLVMLAPLLLLPFAAWVERHWSISRSADRFTFVAVALLAMLLTAFGFATANTLDSRRSNSREIAAALKRAIKPSDLLIVAPEWYAPAFDHYFEPSIEQVDYPYPGRSPAIDFSNVADRTLNVRALRKLIVRVSDARRNGRRIWLVTGPKHIRSLNATEIEEALQPGHTTLTLTKQIGELRTALRASYGAPNNSFTPRGARSRYNEVLLELYSSGPVTDDPVTRATPTLPQPERARSH